MSRGPVSLADALAIAHATGADAKALARLLGRELSPPRGDDAAAGDVAADDERAQDALADDASRDAVDGPVSEPDLTPEFPVTGGGLGGFDEVLPPHVALRCVEVQHFMAPEQRDESLASRGLEPRRRNKTDLSSAPAPRLFWRWGQVAPELREALGARAPGRRVDVPRLVRAFAAGGTLRTARRISRRVWPARLIVAREVGDRLAPLHEDMVGVVEALSRELNAGAVDVVDVCSRGDLLRASRSAREAGGPLLYVGDAAAAGPEAPTAAPGAPPSVAAQRGAHLAEAARGGRVAVAALCARPTPRRLGAARLVRWERAPNAAPAAGEAATTDATDPAAHLFALMSLFGEVPVGLLRALRALVPGAHAGTEVDAWCDPRFDGRGLTGAVREDDAAACLVDGVRLAAAAGTLAQAIGIARAWHEGPRQPGTWATMVVGIDAACAEAGVPSPWRDGTLTSGELTECREVMIEHAAYVAGRTGDGDDSWTIATKQRVARWPVGVQHDPQLGPPLRAALRAASRRVPTLPLNLDLSAWFASVPGPPPADARPWVVALSHAGLTFTPDVRWLGRGAPREPSPIATFDALGDELLWRELDGREWSRLTLDAQTRVPLASVRRGFVLRTAVSELRLEPMQMPAWAHAVGHDRHGLWADWRLGNATQRFRWIPPGRFLMGSPSDEPGRFQKEGPQHWVTIPRGYWLGDTPVTQGLWRAGGAKNPSRFVDAERPVDRVSWDAARDWVDAVSARGRDGEVEALRLPSEPMWEYACRAGTTTALWTGPLTIRGENDGPELDAIAWYGGNSGVDLESAIEGVDSSGWSERQYPHTRAASRKVAAKDPNPWGLYDMLGNVWEWCEDALGPYETRGHVDEAVMSERSERSYRVLRGGSWYLDARFVRAALRYASRPDFAWNYYGFRLARGQGPGGQEDAERPGSGAAAAGRSAGGDRPSDAGGRGGAGGRKEAMRRTP